MPDTQKPVPALVISRAPIVNPDGTARWEFLKILQGWATQIANSLNSLGQFVGIIGSQAKVQGRVETIGLTLQNIGTDGVISTDNLTDGVGSPLAGGAVAFASLVDSTPVPGNVLKYSGTDWTPGDAPGITELTGDGTAGPGSGSQVFTLKVATVGWTVLDGSAANNVGNIQSMLRDTSLSECFLTVTASDATTDLTFDIQQNGVSIFTAAPTVTHGATAGQQFSFPLKTVPLPVAKDDKINLNITAGTSSWKVSLVVR